MPTTFANTINGNEILAKRAVQDINGNDIDQTYAKSASLATVATSGAYGDLSGTPTIPTATSDLQNDSGFITASDIPVTDVEVDGVSVVSGGVASITLPSVPVTDVTVNGTSVVSSGTAAVTVPTATSDLQNDSGFITLSDVPAQVNSDWNAVSGAAEILNKPTIPSGSDLVPPYSIPADEGKVLTVGPSTTYWATPAAGGVTDVEVDGVSVVSQGVASITMPTVDQTYDGTSTNAQSGVAIAGELATINQVPASTSADSGKVLTVDSSGIPGWVTGGGGGSTGLFEAVYGVTTYADVVQAIADQKIVYCRVSPSGASRMAFLAYIGSSNVEFQYYRSLSNHSASNQTDEVYVYTVSSSGWTTTTRLAGIKYIAGTNMSQSYNSSNSTLTFNATMPTVDQTYDGTSVNAQSGTAVAGAIAGVNQVPASTSSDSGKVLTVDSNGDPGWVTGGGGGGVQSDWTEADPTSMAYIENKPIPKTLTAGDGIIVTESSNAITVSSDYNETVLYYNANGENLKNGITLSESRQNFEIIRIIMSLQANHSVGYVDIPMYGINTGTTFTIQPSIPFDEASVGFVLNWKIFITATDTSLTSTNAIYWGKSSCDGTSTNPGTWTQGANINVPYVYKVIGINRVANN